MDEKKGLELSDLEMLAIRRFRQPIERFRAGVITAESALATFMEFLLSQKNIPEEEFGQWGIDMDNKRLVRKPPQGARIPQGGKR